ncbi:MAG: DUF1569 domain-containing protein [Planctomycetota bacterium]
MPTTAHRRPLRFQTLSDLSKDIHALLDAGGGQLSTVGQITPTQNLWHVAYLIECSVKGFPAPFRFPLPYRLIGRLLRQRTLSRPFPEGIKKLPGGPDLDAITFPAPETTLAEAIEYLDTNIAAAAVPGAMKHPSPLFGRLNHEQWTQLHCRHADLHFSFLQAGSN